MAIHGLNISMSVFIGLSAYGLLLYFEGGADTAKATTLLTTLSYVAGVNVLTVSYDAVHSPPSVPIAYRRFRLATR